MRCVLRPRIGLGPPSILPILWISSILWLATGCASAPAPAPGALSIEDVSVIDAVHGLREHQRVVVAGDAIVSVGDAPAPQGARRIDGAGRYLIPGLWDMHVHLTFTPELTAAMPALFLAHGITSVRDTGGPLAELVALREAYEAGPGPAPRLYFSGPLLDGRFVVYDGGDPGRPPIGTRVATPAAAEERVAQLKSAGADFIKIYEMVDPAVFDALVAAAAQHELPIAAHVPLALAAAAAAPQLDSLEHLRNLEIACADNADALLVARREMLAGYEGERGYPLRKAIHGAQRLPAIAAYDAETCDRVIAALADTVQVPTLRLNAFSIARPFERDDWTRALARVPVDALRERWAEDAARRRAAPHADPTFGAWSLRLVGMLHASGVPIGAGTDTPITLAIPGHSLHSELELLVRAGLSPLQALEAATLVPARFLGLGDELGAIEPGRRADLVLLGANPLDDIRHSRQVEGVVSRGRWWSAAELAPARTGTPTAD
jgi:imidazolonepropionase-like amidohydrolase